MIARSVNFTIAHTLRIHESDRQLTDEDARFFSRMHVRLSVDVDVLHANVVGRALEPCIRP